MASSQGLFIGFLVVVLTVWKLICMRFRSQRARFLASLDPVKDARKLLWFSYCVEFPFLSQLGLDFVTFQALQIPSISRLVYQTKELVKHPWKRADDTDILAKEFVHHHVDSDRGSYALRRMNAIHSRYKIPNEEYVYTLCLFTVNSIDFAARFGYRSWTEAEQLAAYTVWHDIAVRMGIKDIPSSIAEMRAFAEDFEAKNSAYDDASHLIVSKVKHTTLDGFPRFLRGFAERGLSVLMGDRLRKATGVPKQPAIVEYFIVGLFKFFSVFCVAAFLPPRPVSMAKSRIDVDWSSNPEAKPDEVRKLNFQVYTPAVYASGYKLAELGALKPGQIAKSHEGSLLCPFRL